MRGEKQMSEFIQDIRIERMPSAVEKSTQRHSPASLGTIRGKRKKQLFM